MAHTNEDGGAVVVVAIIGETKILLIKETTKPEPHYWKFVSERLKNDRFGRLEPILNGLRAGVAEEAGLVLEARFENDEVREIIDPRVKAYRQLLRSHVLPHPRPHRRHFWGVCVSDALIEQLSGKNLTGDVNEEIVTQAFSLQELEKMVDFLPGHRKLLEELKEAMRKEAAC